jgi:hypothetical protein
MNFDSAELMRLLPMLIPVILLEFGLLVWALLDVIRREHVKGGNKLVWVLVIVLINIIGPIVYFLFGREEDSADKDTGNS